MNETRIHLSGPRDITRPDASVVAAVQLQEMFPRTSYALRYDGEGELTYEDGQALVSFAYDTETGDVSFPDIDASIEHVERAQEKLQEEERELEAEVAQLTSVLETKRAESATVNNALRSLYVLEASGHGA